MTMKYQKVLSLLNNKGTQPYKSRTKNELKEVMMPQVESITLIVKQNLRLQYRGKIFVIKVMDTLL